jgi:hypothetical protein
MIPTHLPPSCWRSRAARVVEELFPLTSTSAWDCLIDLRQAILSGTDWDRNLTLFSHCRHALEDDHYLPFYRLRRLLEAHLQLPSNPPLKISPDLLASLRLAPATRQDTAATPLALPTNFRQLA